MATEVSKRKNKQNDKKRYSCTNFPKRVTSEIQLPSHKLLEAMMREPWVIGHHREFRQIKTESQEKGSFHAALEAMFVKDLAFARK